MSAPCPFIVRHSRTQPTPGDSRSMEDTYYREAFAKLDPDELRRLLSRSPELAVAAVRDESVSFDRLLADLLHERRATLPNGDVVEVGGTDRLIEAMRDWLLAEGEWFWTLSDPDDGQVLAAIAELYTGGVDQFLDDWNAEHGIGIGERA